MVKPTTQWEEAVLEVDETVINVTSGSGLKVQKPPKDGQPGGQASLASAKVKVEIKAPFLKVKDSFKVSSAHIKPVLSAF